MLLTWFYLFFWCLKMQYFKHGLSFLPLNVVGQVLRFGPLLCRYSTSNWGPVQMFPFIPVNKVQVCGYFKCMCTILGALVMWWLVMWMVRLFQVKMEREQYQTEIRDLQDQLSEMHDELDLAKKSAANGEKDVIIAVRQCSLFQRRK